MSSYEEFRELLKEGKNREAFLLALSNSLQLTIKTASSKTQLSLETQINLLKGISNIITSPEAVKNPKTPLEIEVIKFHEAQKKQAYQIWRKNRETLIEIFQIITGKDTEEGVETETERYEGEKQEYQQEIHSWLDRITDDILGEEEAMGGEEREETLSAEKEIAHNNGVYRDSSTSVPKLELEAEEEEMMIEAAATLESPMELEEEEEGGKEDKPEVEIEIGEEWEEWLKEDEDENSSHQHLEEIDWREEDWSEGEEEGEEGGIGSNHKS